MTDSELKFPPRPNGWIYTRCCGEEKGENVFYFDSVFKAIFKENDESQWTIIEIETVHQLN
jgi:hypothetical protein